MGGNGDRILEGDTTLSVRDNDSPPIVSDDVGIIYYHSVHIEIFFGTGDLVHIVWAQHAFICNAGIALQPSFI